MQDSQFSASPVVMYQGIGFALEIEFLLLIRKSVKSIEHSHEKVFLRDGNPISPKDKSFRRWIVAIVRGTELEGMSRMHEFRHTTGRILGLTHSLHEIKEFLGHTDIRTTERYVRVGDAAKKSMAKSLEQFGRK